MRKLPTWLLLLVGVAVCLGLDVGYDAIVGGDRAMKFWLSILVISAINVLGATSLNVVNGMAGQFSIGHAGFVGIGAYLGGFVAAKTCLAIGVPVARMQENLPISTSLIVLPVVFAAVALVCAGVGLVVGLPSLRLRGDYLAIVTLGFAEILRLTIFGITVDNAHNPITRGIASLGGALGYQGPLVDGRPVGIPSLAGPLWTVGLAGLGVFLALRLKRSGFGRALRAVREDEIAASAVGVDPARYKVTAFILAAVGAGIAGALVVLRRDGPNLVSPTLMKFDKSFEVITMVILGGSGSVGGAAIGAVIYTCVFYGVEELLQTLGRDSVPWLAQIDAPALRMTLFAASLIVVMLVRPEGIFGEREPFEKKLGDKPAPPPDAPASPDAVSAKPAEGTAS